VEDTVEAIVVAGQLQAITEVIADTVVVSVIAEVMDIMAVTAVIMAGPIGG
jgi:hypothetical protein